MEIGRMYADGNGVTGRSSRLRVFSRIANAHAEDSRRARRRRSSPTPLWRWGGITSAHSQLEIKSIRTGKRDVLLRQIVFAMPMRNKTLARLYLRGVRLVAGRFRMGRGWLGCRQRASMSTGHARSDAVNGDSCRVRPPAG